MSNNADLSPWAHPKTQGWFHQVLTRSGFLDDLERTLRQPVEKISLGQCRMILMMVILLGRPGIWPPGYEELLELVDQRVNEVLAIQQKPGVAQKLTIHEHRQREAVMREVKVELEFLRRRIGKSRLKTPLSQPETWGNFWQ